MIWGQEFEKSVCYVPLLEIITRHDISKWMERQKTWISFAFSYIHIQACFSQTTLQDLYKPLKVLEEIVVTIANLDKVSGSLIPSILSTLTFLDVKPSKSLKWHERVGSPLKRIRNYTPLTFVGSAKAGGGKKSALPRLGKKSFQLSKVN